MEWLQRFEKHSEAQARLADLGVETGDDLAQLEPPELYSLAGFLKTVQRRRFLATFVTGQAASIEASSVGSAKATSGVQLPDDGVQSDVQPPTSASVTGDESSEKVSY